jgi:spore germination protein GerM
MHLKVAALAVAAVLLASCGTRAQPAQSQGVPQPTNGGAATASPALSSVTLFFPKQNSTDCTQVVPATRRIADRGLTGVMKALVAGPNEPERAMGLGGWFTDQTKDVVNSAQVEGGVARVDFKDLRAIIPNASSSCGSSSLLAQLDSTAKQFGVTRTLYSINADVDLFYNWLQRAAPAER